MFFFSASSEVWPHVQICSWNAPKTQIVQQQLSVWFQVPILYHCNEIKQHQIKAVELVLFDAQFKQENVLFVIAFAFKDPACRI